MELLKEKNKTIDWIILSPVAFTFTGVFLYENSVKNILVIIAVACIASILTYGTSHIKSQLKENKFIWLIFATLIYGIVQYNLHGYSNGLIKTYLFLTFYFLIAPSILFIKIRRNLFYLVILATISSVIFYIQQTYFLEKTRSNWELGVLHYTVFSSWLACYAANYLLNTKKVDKVIISATIISINIFIINATQARTSLMVTLITIGIILFYTFRKSPKAIILSFITSLILIFVSINSSSILEHRILQTNKEINNILNGNYDTSIGHRIKMWKAATMIVPISPIIGVGDAHKDIKKKLAKEGKVFNKIVSLKHYHNDYINSLVKNGIIGLILMICLLFYPLIEFLKRRNSLNIPLLSLFIIFSISAITNVPFTNLHLIIFFLMISWIYIASSNHDQDLEHRR